MTKLGELVEVKDLRTVWPNEAADFTPWLAKEKNIARLGDTIGVEITDLTYIDLQHLGYKSAMVNISDIFAMNGTPRQLTVSIALSKRFKVEDMEEFYSGLRMACDKWGVDIVGGDTTSSYTGLAISITCIGEARKEDIVYRNGAKDTDLICVTGDLGAAYMGLQLLEREKSVYYQQVDEARKKNDKRALEELKGFQPDFAGKEYLLQRQLQTEARGDIIARFRELNIRPTAMMDISDGLSSELMHICKQSNCGCSAEMLSAIESTGTRRAAC